MYLAILSLVTVVAAAWTWLPRQAPLQQEDLAPVEHSLADVPEVPQRVRVLGYDRAAFGAGWRPEGGCTMREAVISAQFSAAPAVDCALPRTLARDPYAGEDLAADEVEIDHVFPLSAAWDLGAHSWDDARRSAFANDPRNLVAVHRSVNQQKSDQLPAQWLPPDPSARCWYVQRLAEVAAVYGLALPGEDARVMRAQCRSGIPLGG